MNLKKDTILKPKMEIKEEKKESKTEESAEVLKNPFASKECIDILNFRIEQEEQSSRLYQSMSLYLNNEGFMGAAKAWARDAEDEMKHAQWAKEFLLDMGIQPLLPALKQPQQTFEGLCDIMEKTYEHDIVVTQQCNDLASHALKYNNHLLYQLALKYLAEQQEEISRTITNLDKLRSFGEDKIALRLFDTELGQ